MVQQSTTYHNMSQLLSIRRKSGSRCRTGAYLSRQCTAEHHQCCSTAQSLGKAVVLGSHRSGQGLAEVAAEAAAGVYVASCVCLVRTLDGACRPDGSAVFHILPGRADASAMYYQVLHPLTRAAAKQRVEEARDVADRRLIRRLRTARHGKRRVTHRQAALTG